MQQLPVEDALLSVSELVLAGGCSAVRGGSSRRAASLQVSCMWIICRQHAEVASTAIL